MQSTHALRVLPAFLICAAPVLSKPAIGQARYRVTTDGEWFHQEANGRRLARLARGAFLTGTESTGAEGTGEDAPGDWVRIVIEGWIWGESVGPTPRAGFDLTVTRAPEENLRSSAGGALVAKLAQGFLLNKVAEDGQWVRVQRSGWVRRTGLEEAPGLTPGLTPGRGPGVSAPVTDSVPSAPGPSPEPRVQPTRQTPLYRAPEGPEAGSLSPETPLRVIEKAGEWTRVQVEGWVKTEDVATAPPGVLVGVSAAELRADPARYEGKVVQWALQYVSTQVADDLRPEIPAGMTYLLARGPLPERGFVYVVVAEGRRSLIETLTPLAALRVTARVRAGRSRFIGNPVVDLLTLEVLP